MKVLFVTRGWPTKKDPMCGNYEAVQAKALAKKGVDVTVLTYRWHSIFHAFRELKTDSFMEEGVRVIQTGIIMPIIPRLLNTERLRFWGQRYSLKKCYKQILQQFGPFDIVHAHILYMAFSASVFKEKCGIPFVITEHWSALNKASVSSHLKAISSTYNKADAVIAVSQVLAASLKEKFGVRSRVIHNMVSDVFFKSLAHSRFDGLTRFVSTGTLLAGKGFDILIQAIDHAKYRDNCLLTIIGDGPEKENLKRYIKTHRLQEHVILAGRKKPEDVNHLLLDADCFILTSRRETFGIVYIEAMAKGLPVIATRCGGPEGFVNEKNGLIVPVDDIEATADAIDYMVEHKENYNHEEIRQFCHDNFSQDEIADQIIDVYQQVLDYSR